ncbi:MAG: transcription antitermination protein NusB, partial [Candidatus Binatia bacterium]
MSPNQEDTTANTGSGRSRRRKGRELALQALYQIEITGDGSTLAVDQFLSHFDGTAPAKDFARQLVSGVVSQRAEIDGRIEQSTENWKLTRL